MEYNFRLHFYNQIQVTLRFYGFNMALANKLKIPAHANQRCTRNLNLVCANYILNYGILTMGSIIHFIALSNFYK
ncbi:uncharacterized protein BdWA1_003894 [Babesia duncani]|uniref:Uncharacterized protein n=1 Tax=Babesia duncani TaxID=323732 RepID=A0AAD9UMG3_9APIC|nr:hypothetical protein BdWA1_003894 [Babesia duncani]